MKNIGKKNSNLEPVYVWAPYIPMTTTSVIVEKGYKNIIRKKKINKVFDLGLDIKGDIFSPNKNISSRYSAIKINNPYNTIFVGGNMI